VGGVLALTLDECQIGKRSLPGIQVTLRDIGSTLGSMLLIHCYCYILIASRKISGKSMREGFVTLEALDE
jgi:hypothetical protein